MSAQTPIRQRGAALIILLAILVIGATWFMVTRVASLSLTHTASERERNAVVLKRAKESLIGFVAMQASQSGEDNPGRLPCPEAPGSIGGTNEGQAAGNCTLPAVGRLPWRTLGLDKLVDARGQPLWYVVSPGWAVTSGDLTINSNTVGQLTVDGQANAAVALIIAPGAPMNVQASAGCTARNQLSRPAPAPGINAADYLECFNSATGTFSTVGPATSFNDQAVVVSTADILPPLEAAVAHRFQREMSAGTGFGSAFKSVYAAGTWGLTNVAYPFAAPFADPSTSPMQGAAGTYSGLLPLNFAESSPGSGTACSPGTDGPRCAPTFVAWTGTPTMSGGSVYSTDCSGSSASQISCTFYYRCLLIFCALPASVPFTVDATASNVGMALRRINSSVTMTNVATAGRTVSATLNASGSANVTINGTASASGSGGLLSGLLCGVTGLLSLTVGCKQGSITVPVLLFADHPILDPNDANYGWFIRNKWHELTYYAVAQGYSPAGAPATSCTNGSTCLTVSNVSPAGKQRAILIFAGRSINGSPRPSANLTDYLEFGNAGGNWESQTVTAAPPSMYVDVGGANAYIVPVASVQAGLPIEFRALNSNTGASTLNTPATGGKSIRNSDGTALASGQIRANAAVQVVYDGSQFVLTKRPFNDRVIVLDANP
jgi:hypothetical protein